jgi:dTDP-4-dehydrorhamnose reductase
VTAATAGRALITGAAGQVGLALQGKVPSGWTVIPCGMDELDVTRSDQVQAVLRRARPTVVIHTAAYTAVDAAESDAARAEAVNARGTAHVADAARDIGARLLHVSTDFVFDGAQGRPYAPDDPPHPLGVYGRTKLAAEREAIRALGDRAVIVRTAWVYSRHGQNFVRTMLRLMQERDEVGVVADQVGTPTWADSLADALWAAAGRDAPGGVLHWTDAGVASWYDFAVAIQEEALAAGLLPRSVPIRPLRTGEYPAPAPRPPYSVLDKSATWALLGHTPPHWRVNLRRMLQELARG